MKGLRTTIRFLLAAVVLAQLLFVGRVAWRRYRATRAPLVIGLSDEEIARIARALPGTQTSPPVILVGADWCPACRELKAELDDQRVQYLYADIEVTDDAKRLHQHLQSLGVYTIPQLVVGRDRVEPPTASALKQLVDRHRLTNLPG